MVEAEADYLRVATASLAYMEVYEGVLPLEVATELQLQVLLDYCHLTQIERYMQSFVDCHYFCLIVLTVRWYALNYPKVERDREPPLIGRSVTKVRMGAFRLFVAPLSSHPL